MRERNFCREESSNGACDTFFSESVTFVPSNRVIVRPSSWRSKSSGELAIRSIILPSSISFSVNALDSVMAFSASSGLRPRLSVKLRRNAIAS